MRKCEGCKDMIPDGDFSHHFIGDDTDYEICDKCWEEQTT